MFMVFPDEEQFLWPTNSHLNVCTYRQVSLAAFESEMSHVMYLVATIFKGVWCLQHDVM